MNLYPFIEAEKLQQRNVKRACELLEVSRAAYYTHCAGAPSARQVADEQLTERIATPTRRPRAAHGAPRIHAQLRRQGRRHGRKRVARLMRAAGLHGAPAPFQAHHDSRSGRDRLRGSGPPGLCRERRGQHPLVW